LNQLALPLFLAAWVGGSVAPAAAQEEVTVRQKLLAKQVYRHALELYQAAKYREAADELQKAYTYAPLPQILFNLGVTYAKLGDRRAAHAALSEYLAALPNAPNRAEAEKWLKQIGTVEETAAKAPAAAPAAAPASAPEASAKAEAAPPPAPTAPARPHDDEENPLLDAKRVRPVEAEGTEAPATPNDHPSTHFRIWKWGVAGAGVAAATVGVLMLMRAGDQSDTLRRATAAPGTTPTTRYDGDIMALENGYSSNRRWGTVALVGGGVAVATSITMFILDHREEAARSATLRPAVGPGLAAIELGGRF
jgi:hypothetical protein